MARKIVALNGETFTLRAILPSDEPHLERLIKDVNGKFADGNAITSYFGRFAARTSRAVTTQVDHLDRKPSICLGSVRVAQVTGLACT